MEVNDAIRVPRLWSRSITSPNGLLDLEAAALEVTDFKTKQFTGAKTRRCGEDEKHSHFSLDCREKLRDLLPGYGWSALVTSINYRRVNKLRIPLYRIELISVVIQSPCLREFDHQADVLYGLRSQ